MSETRPQQSDPLGEIPAELLASLKNKSQIEFDIEFFDSVLRNAPRNLDVLRCQGELLSRKGLHGQALEVDRRLAELTPGDAVVQYNLACSLARNELLDESLDALRRACTQGYDDFEHLELDGDLDAIRNDPRFRSLMDEFHPQNPPKRRSKKSRKK